MLLPDRTGNSRGIMQMQQIQIKAFANQSPHWGLLLIKINDESMGHSLLDIKHRSLKNNEVHNVLK